MACPLSGNLVQPEAAALVAHSLSTVQPVLTHRWATTLQQLKRWSFQAVADQFRERIRPALRLPARDRYQQTALWQIALKTRANRLQRVNILIPAQGQNQLAHGAAVPRGCTPGQGAHALHPRFCKPQTLLAGLAETCLISF